MSYDLKEVQLWIRENGSHRLIVTVTGTSKFTSMPWFNRLSYRNDEHLIKAAKEQRDGWKFNGPWPDAKFEVVAGPHKGEEYLV